MFWIKSNKIHLDCFTNDQLIAEDNPIQKTSNFIPDWWKKLPNKVHLFRNNVDIPHGTMKSCLGFIDLYSKGVVIPLWADLNLKAERDTMFYGIAKSGNVFGDSVGFHVPDQYNNHYKGHTHFKLITPWFFKEKTGIDFLFTGCVWNMLDKFPKISILNGVLNFSNMFVANVNGFMSSEGQPYQYDIEAGTPLVQMIPLSDKEVVPHIHILDNMEWSKMSNATQPYKFIRWGVHKNRLNKN